MRRKIWKIDCIEIFSNIDLCILIIDYFINIIEWDCIYFNVDQRIIFDILYQAIASDKEDMFFLDKFDDIRKTFLINLILTKIRSNEDIALTTASSDIAAILLNESTTTHSRFKISIDINSDSIYNIFVQNHLIELIWETKLIFWDEISM